MSSSFTSDIKQLFAQALKDPNSISDSDFDLLLSEYPFAQSLVFAYQRRSTLANPSNHTVQKALLHTDNHYWLHELIGEREEDAEAVEIEAEELESEELESEDIQEEATAQELEAVEIEPVDTQEEPAAQDPAAVEIESKELESVDIQEEATAQEPEDELADLILEQAQSIDYFALEKSSIEAESSVVDEPTAILPLVSTDNEQAEEESDDDVSVYDDELMPYSFRWWLYKTRLQHADTYQPFVSAQALTTRADGQYVPPRFDETILDHQIRENIFHLQNPEDKLSDSIRQKTVEVTMPKKTDAVIERFIREEPQIQPPTPDVVNNENKARKSAEDHFSLVTETLANIYIEQGLYPKAIDVFRKLISINPEKKVYFASRIEELEQKF